MYHSLNLSLGQRDCFQLPVNRYRFPVFCYNLFLSLNLKENLSLPFVFFNLLLPKYLILFTKYLKLWRISESNR